MALYSLTQFISVLILYTVSGAEPAAWTRPRDGTLSPVPGAQQLLEWMV